MKARSGNGDGGRCILRRDGKNSCPFTGLAGKLKFLSKSNIGKKLMFVVSPVISDAPLITMSACSQRFARILFLTQPFPSRRLFLPRVCQFRCRQGLSLRNV